MSQKTTTNDKLSKRGIARNHIHKRVLVQLAIFAVITTVLAVIVSYDIVHTRMNVLWVISALAAGVIVGLAVGRIFAMKWHEDTQKIMISMDKLSILLIVAYVGFRYFSEQFLGQFLHGQELTVITFCILGGIMIGRVIGMLRSIVAILKQQAIL